MPRIRCEYIDCVYLEDGYCGTSAIELDPDQGCLTYAQVGDIPEDEEWEDEDLEEFWDEDEEDLYMDDEEGDDWLEEDEF